MKRRFILYPPLLMVLVTPAVTVAAEIKIATRQPLEGEPIRVEVTEDGRPVAGAAVQVTYRPNSKVAREVAVGKTDPQGGVVWTPEVAGIATLKAAGASFNVAIRFPAPPLSGIAVFLVAGTLLFGGIYFSYRRLKNQP